MKGIYKNGIYKIGIGGVIFGPEFERLDAHWDQVNRLATLHADEYGYNVLLPEIALHLQIAGSFEPDIVTRIGRASYSKTYNELSIDIFIGFESYLNLSEIEFRRVFATLLKKAFQRICACGSRRCDVFDDQLLESQIKDLLDDYCELPIPTAANLREPGTSSCNDCDPSVEVQLAFSSKAASRKAIKNLEEFGSLVSEQYENGKYWIEMYATSKDASIELVKQARKFCSEVGGEFDGFSTSSSDPEFLECLFCRVGLNKHELLDFLGE